MWTADVAKLNWLPDKTSSLLISELLSKTPGLQEEISDNFFVLVFDYSAK